jgi:hypothetical protein
VDVIWAITRAILENNPPVALGAVVTDSELCNKHTDLPIAVAGIRNSATPQSERSPRG